MAAGLSRPDVWLGIALNRDPNDVNTPSVWTSLQSTDLQVLSSTGQMRGRDYELAQPMAADPVLLVRDVNEHLNPDNPDSPHAGLVNPYREVCAVCQWPITATGGNNNLINSGTWRGSNVDAYDPTFESYITNGVAPNWMDRYGVSTLITTSNPQQGSKSVLFIVGGSPGQGLGWGVPCIPGRQYTSSAYVRQDAANTVGLFLEGVTAVWDRFNRTSVNSLGTPNASWTGAAYTTSGGAAGDYDVADGYATQVNTATDVPRYGLIDTNFFDSDQTIRVTAPVLATGAGYVEGLTSRWVDANNHYRAFFLFNTDQTITLSLRRRLASVQVILDEIVLPFTYEPGDQFDLNFVTRGNYLQFTAWPIDRHESRTYQVIDTDASAALQVASKIGFFSFRTGGNTNTDLPATFSRYAASASVAGTSTTTSGSYVRLSITYTADGVGRPAHVDAHPLGKLPAGLAISVMTTGASVASANVQIDAIQHEQAASASTFSATGPVIYPLFRNFAERYPRTWRAKGYEGIVAIPCVDALALLNKISVSNPATQAILNTQPDFYWSLSGGVDSLAFPDQSGDGGPALVPVASKYGAGTAPEPGTASNVPGDPDGTGVAFAFTAGGSVDKRLGTCLGVGTGAADSIALPPTTGVDWSMSFMAWVSGVTATGASPDAESVIIQALKLGGSGLTYRPLSVQTDGVYFNNGASSLGVLFPSPGDPYGAGVHLVGGTISQVVGGNTALTAWLDGVSDNSIVTTASVGLLAIGASALSVGGAFSGNAFGGMLNGTVSHVAVWNRVVTSAEVQSIYGAGQFGLNGEVSGARLLRHLQDGPYNGPTRIAIGSTAMGIPSFDGSIDLLTDSLNTMQAEGGMLWAQPDGVIAFEGREDRWLRLTSTNTFGEDAAGGEIPYQDGIVFDHDPTYVFPIVTWTRTGGATALGGLPTDRRAASDRYFPRQFDGSNDLYDDATAQDLADWIFYTHRSPLTRVAEIEIDPWAAQGVGAGFWAKALSLEVGQRVTAVRRVSSANAGAGLTMSVPCFVERVGAPEINFTMGEERWTISLQLSPIGSAPDGPTVQPWILGDATYGVLDSTTVLGF